MINTLPTDRFSGEGYTQHMSYVQQWKHTPRYAGFLFASFPVALVVLAIVISLFSVGLSLALFGVGLVIWRFGLVLSRDRGAVWRDWVVRADGRPIAAPAVTGPPAHAESWVAEMRRALSVRSDWRAMLHQGLLGFMVAALTWSVALLWAVTAVAGLLYWALVRVVPQHPDNISVSELIWPDRVGVDISPIAADSILYAALGLVFLVTLPPIYRVLVAANWQLARVLLGESESDALRREVADLESSRGAQASAENRTLGQLERDLHDGPQQRLVRLQMDLATAERRLADNPDAAAEAIGEARSTARETLDELRALSRGFAPPILADRGLRAALETLAARGPIPISLAVTATVPLPAEIERGLYFVATELIANSAKHSGASQISVTLADGPGPLDVTLVVQDHGSGGIVELPGHGIAGLRERVRGMGGSFQVVSPAGGPSIVSATVPVPRQPVS